MRQRLLNLRVVRQEDYNALLTQYAIERFLYRLSLSDSADRFVLKGAMLFRVWSGALHRPTKDLDLLGLGNPTLEAVVDTAQRIISTPVSDDGISFDSTTLQARKIGAEKEYKGIRIKLTAHLGTARIPMQIDVGFGDAITPRAQLREYPTLLCAEALNLRMYPPETVIAEKIEAVIRLGMANSRFKDYFDLITLLRDEDLTFDMVVKAIAATFQRRQTQLPAELPPGLSNQFGEDLTSRRQWRDFIRRIKTHRMPQDFFEVVVELRDRIWPALTQARLRN